MNQTVHVTGSGLICSLGDHPATVNDLLCAGKSGIHPIDLFDTQGYGGGLGGQILNYQPETYLGDRNFRPLDRTGLLAVTAGGFALENAGLSAEDLEQHEMGLVLGTMYCSVHTITTFDLNAQTAGIRYAKPMDFANTVINAASGQMGIWHNLRGINSTIATGPASGLKALLYAYHLIQSGQADVVLAGGAEELCFESYLSFHRAGATAAEEPGGRAFDPQSRGFHLGEAAAFLVLESEAHAKARGAKAVAQIIGGEESYDPGRGGDAQAASDALAQTTCAALAEAGLSPADIHCISVSANGSPLWDGIEDQALGQVFGQASPPRTAVKSALGECLGASGAVQAVNLIQAMNSGCLPHWCDGRHTQTRGDFRTGLIQSLGMDGGACSVILTRPGGSHG